MTADRSAPQGTDNLKFIDWKVGLLIDSSRVPAAY
jgi:hypothetical protein